MHSHSSVAAALLRRTGYSKARNFPGNSLSQNDKKITQNGVYVKVETGYAICQLDEKQGQSGLARNSQKGPLRRELKEQPGL